MATFALAFDYKTIPIVYTVLDLRVPAEETS